MYADKPVPVLNLPPLRFIRDPSKKGITDNIYGAWDLDISVAVVTTLGVPVGEALSDIIINFKRAVIHLECDCEKDWLKSLEEGWRNQSADQWVEWLTRPALED